MLGQLTGVALGGALGSLCRFTLGRALTRWDPSPHVSAGVLAANLLGCFAIGLMLGKLSAVPPAFRDALWAFLVTGFLGGLTTFSTFSLELFQLSSGPLWRAALPYTLAHLLGGLVCVSAGYHITKLV